MNPFKHIIVGISGGVDSSVAALVLKQQGHHVEAVFMKNWDNDDTDTYCPASVDIADAQAVCDKLDIPLHKVNFAAEYWQHVFSYFLKEYAAGRTPNPDVLCNKEIKFKAFLDYAKNRGADYIATGHYAAIHEGNQLFKAQDDTKDQSYFLHLLSEAQLSQSLFPLGDLKKTQVREMALKAGLITHQKKDSTGICFIGERKFKTFLNEFLPAQPGNIENDSGKTIGRHDGLMFYTIGQRQGLQIGGIKHGAQAPWYVAAKDLTRNVLIVVQGHDHPMLFGSRLSLTDLHWINAAPPMLPIKLQAKTRYRQADQACELRFDNGQYLVYFDQPQRAITPGQSVVFYQAGRCLGGGIIDAMSQA